MSGKSKKSKRKTTARKEIRMPTFKSEVDEARWHNSPEGHKYWQQQFEAAKAKGTLVLAPDEDASEDEDRLIIRTVDWKDYERLKAKVESETLKATRPVTLRIPIVQIGKARQLAEKRGTRYQTLLKEFITEGLRRA